MFTKKMMTRIAQVAPLAVVVSLSLSPAFAHRRDSDRPRHRGTPSVRVVSLTPAQGFRSGPGTISVSAESIFKKKHRGTPSVRTVSLTPAQGFRSGPGTISVSAGSTFDPDGNSNGPSSTRGGATPGSDVNPPNTTRGTVDSGPTERGGIDVDLDPGYGGRARRLHPRDETVPVIDVDGAFPVGTLEVEEAGMTSAARSATRTPQVLLPKIEQAPIAAGARSFSRTQFAVGMNGEEGLSASATFVFGRH